MGFLKKLAEMEEKTTVEEMIIITIRRGSFVRQDYQGVPVQVAVESSNLGPVLQPCVSGDGGIQGLRWYTKRLEVDEDGDVADEFLEEGLTEKPTNAGDDSSKATPRLQSKHKTKPAKVRGLVLSSDGRKLQQCIEHQGRLLIV